MTSVEEARTHFLSYATEKHILDVAHRVHPTWLLANGHKRDAGVEDLAREIGQCIATIEHMVDQGDHNWVGFAMGHGIVVVPGPGIDGYSVCVIAGEVFCSKLPGGFRADG